MDIGIDEFVTSSETAQVMRDSRSLALTHIPSLRILSPLLQGVLLCLSSYFPPSGHFPSARICLCLSHPRQTPHSALRPQAFTTVFHTTTLSPLHNSQGSIRGFVGTREILRNCDTPYTFYQTAHRVRSSSAKQIRNIGIIQHEAIHEYDNKFVRPSTQKQDRIPGPQGMSTPNSDLMWHLDCVVCLSHV